MIMADGQDGRWGPREEALMRLNLIYIHISVWGTCELASRFHGACLLACLLTCPRFPLLLALNDMKKKTHTKMHIAVPCISLFS